MPVYNGENFIQEAIDSILCQDFEDFELVISDNCSTDNTQEICRSYSDKDKRVRYILQENNLGAAPNFNYLFEISNSPFFKWAAHDDILEPSYFRKCIEALKNRPNCVLCTSYSKTIDNKGELVRHYDACKTFDQPQPHQRFAELVRFHKHPFYEIFGIIRSSALQGSYLIPYFSGGDGVLLAQLSLRGEFAIIPEYLFLPRRHPDQSQQFTNNKRGYNEWFYAGNSGKVRMPHFEKLAAYFHAIRSSDLDFQTKIKCYSSLIKQTCTTWRPIRGDLRRAIEDTFHIYSYKIKNTITK